MIVINAFQPLKGNDLSIDKTIAIAILARDCEKYLPKNIQKIENLRKHFRDSLVVVIENDSIDRTKNILKEWERNSGNIVVISEDYHAITIPEKTEERPLPGASRYRMDKMCFYRNKYMEYLRSIDAKFDYLMIIDIDIDDFSEQGIINAIINAPPDWTALFANGIKYMKFFTRIRMGYYDGYPLILLNENDGNIIIDRTFKELMENVYKLMKETKKNKYIKCISAFGGIGIYKYQYIKDANYFTIPNNQSSIIEVLCDHVSINYALFQKKVGTSYIVSEMVVYYKQIKNIKLFLLEILPLNLTIFLYEFFKRKKYPV